MIMDLKSNTIETVSNFFGFIKIWKVNPKTGDKELVLDKKNTILYGGADILAYAITGKENSAISHFYLAYNNTPGFVAPDYTVDKANPSFTASGQYGYLRVPLTFPAAFLKDTNYNNNIPVFTILISDPYAYQVAGSPSFSADSSVFELGLVSALTPNSPAGDIVFARAQFTPIIYDPTFNFTISWGVKFSAD